jgi:hypothetical protein
VGSVCGLWRTAVRSDIQIQPLKCDVTVWAAFVWPSELWSSPALRVVRGFRSCFRGWCAEATAHTREVAEQALAHALPDKVEAAYRCGDMLEKRRRLLEEWAAFCGEP